VSASTALYTPENTAGKLKQLGKDNGKKSWASVLAEKNSLEMVESDAFSAAARFGWPNWPVASRLHYDTPY